MTWKDPLIIIGNKATGDYYFRRTQIEEDIIKEITKGNHVLVAAPRRVGKTSVMAYLCDNCDPSWKCIYENIQGITAEQELYQRLYELILSCLRKDKQLWKKSQDFIKGINIEEIGTDKVKLGDRQELDFAKELDDIIPQLPSDIKVVLYLDELPEVLHYLHKHNKIEEANRILKNLRRWRQGKEYKSLCMVVTGSIGLHHIVSNITGRTTDNNDYGLIDFEPFNYQQGYAYIDYVTDDATIKYNPQLKQYLLDKINYKIPYFINLLINEVNLRARKLKTTTITEEDIDIAFDKIVKESKHFRDWKKRLYEYFEKSKATFLDEVLTTIAHKEKINIQQIYNLAVKHNKTDQYMELINILSDDGYILERNDGYAFRSPFLQAFWKRENPRHND